MQLRPAIQRHNRSPCQKRGPRNRSRNHVVGRAVCRTDQTVARNPHRRFLQGHQSRQLPGFQVL